METNIDDILYVLETSQERGEFINDELLWDDSPKFTQTSNVITGNDLFPVEEKE